MKITSTVTILSIALSTLVFLPAAHADSNNYVKFKSRVNLKVGQSTIIHGKRSECGKLPSKAQLAADKKKLDAKLTTGHIIFGKPGVRKSASCGGETPVYETIFVADKPGRETVEIHGDKVRFKVK